MRAKSVLGFTLIELMLVIAILGLLTVAGVSMLQIKAKNFKVEKCAIEMQQWLQAGVAYYVEHPERGWPKTVQDLVDGDYMPEKSDKNPWGKPFVVAVTDQKSKLFAITTELPDNQLAAQIKARLPLAQLDSNNAGIKSVVRALASIPQQISKMKNQWTILQMNVVDGGSEIKPNYTCPVGMEKRVNVVPYPNAKELVIEACAPSTAQVDENKAAASNYLF